jgi:lipoyl(octanoyl) transferase
MREYTAARDQHSADQLWIVEHPPVYTVGVAGRSQHLPRIETAIPVVRVDRGGQITYHGPGQLVLYTLLDLTRRALSVRALVRLLERAVIDLLGRYRIEAAGRVDAPGVYVGTAKIAALGLRVRNGRCYHGLALNVDMDLSPFLAIDPCGYPGMAVTSVRALGVAASQAELGEALASILLKLLSEHRSHR